MDFTCSTKEIILKIHVKFSVPIFYFFFSYLELTLSHTVERIYFSSYFSFLYMTLFIPGAKICPWSCFSNSGDGFTLIIHTLWTSLLHSLESRPISGLPQSWVKWTVPCGDFTQLYPGKTKEGLSSQSSFLTLLTNHQ